MTRLAHLSDMHLNGSTERRLRFGRALGQAAESGVDHLLLTGDLTASGKPEQYVELANMLAEWPSEMVTVVPGNHDGGPKAWCCALNGPLRRFAPTSAPGAVANLGDALVTPISTEYPNRAPLFGGRGYVAVEQLVWLDRVARLAQGLCVVVAAHHGPQSDPMHMLLGLTNQEQVGYVLGRHGHVVWCCGHDHRTLDLGRVFAAASVASHDDPLRTYEVVGTTIVPTYQNANMGSYL